MVKNLKIGISLGLLAILSTLILQARAELIEVYTWKVFPGKGAQMLETFVAARAIHEEMGARVEIYTENVGTPGRVHYVMLWDSYSDWAGTTAKMSNSKA
tara:strand:- start:3705 stop:4004 length:300 start_codon:yes stop_codon:yes gene_type:complete